ncbi:hypothetical protein MMC22_009440 [Lobaria immixta]|nr:hypothetical protein [Lobaria immixta]
MLWQALTSTMRMTNFTLHAETGNRILRNVNVQPRTQPTMASQPVLIQPVYQKPLEHPQPSPTSASSFTSSTLVASSSPLAYVAPKSTSIHEDSPSIPMPAAKPLEETATRPVEYVALKPAPKPATTPDYVQAPKPSAIPAPKPVLKSDHVPAPKPLDQPKPHPSKPVVGTSGSHWCMAYSPYNTDGTCKSSSSVASDVKSIAERGFSSIRLYSTDCSGLPNVGNAAKANGLKLVLGVFISNSGIAGAKAQLGDITSWVAGNWGDVEMIVVGNEAVFNGYCTASALADFISSAKSTFAAAGYTGPVTTTEPLNVMSENAHLLCPMLDVAAANIHPFFNAAVTADGAGEFVAKELALLETICPGLAVYNLETGWPSAGLPNGAAIPGPSEQAAAIESIKKHCGGNSAFFSFVDDPWKAKGEFGV